jgi:hypothetical protein
MEKSSSIEISSGEYSEKFKGYEKVALLQALDIRKFEIELYWKRASYFWTFIGATFAGFISIHAFQTNNFENLSIILSCFGLVFSCAWFFVNKGSKFWQENWEKHVDLLEDSITGPLYKTVIKRNDDLIFKDKINTFLTGPSQHSVSKINQLISLYILVLWIILLIYSLPKLSLDRPINWFLVILISISLLTCYLFYTVGKSYSGGYYHIASIRKSRIKPEP